MMLKGLILAAGRGSRMKNLTNNMPKHMLPAAGKPILEHVVTHLRDAGITSQIIVTGYRGNMIEDYFRDGSGFGIKITYAHQPTPDGTGGAVLTAREAVGVTSFLLTFGDIVVTSETYRALIDTYVTSPCDALLALNWVEDPYEGAAVFLDEQNRVTHIIEKPAKGSSNTHWNQAGIFIFDSLIFDYCSRLNLSQRGEYELTEAVSNMIKDGLNVHGSVISGAWCDVGRPDDLPAVEQILEE